MIVVFSQIWKFLENSEISKALLNFRKFCRRNTDCSANAIAEQVSHLCVHGNIRRSSSKRVLDRWLSMKNARVRRPTDSRVLKTNRQPVDSSARLCSDSVHCMQINQTWREAKPICLILWRPLNDHPSHGNWIQRIASSIAYQTSSPPNIEVWNLWSASHVMRVRQKLQKRTCKAVNSRHRSLHVCMDSSLALVLNDTLVDLILLDRF